MKYTTQLYKYNLLQNIKQVTKSFDTTNKQYKSLSHSQKRLRVHLANIPVLLATRSQWSFPYRPGNPRLAVSVVSNPHSHQCSAVHSVCPRPELSQIALESTSITTIYRVCPRPEFSSFVPCFRDRDYNV